MSGKGAKTDQPVWLKVATVALVAVATATATSAGNHGGHVVTGGSAGCVTFRLA